MSANKRRLHVHVLPEDDANRQMLDGFLLEFPTRQIHRLRVAGGWKKLLDRFKSDEVAGMETNPHRLMVLLVDFDGRSDRRNKVGTVIPAHLADRVFVLGVWTEPEDLKKAGLGSFETIGRALAKDCREGTTVIWSHELLKHNAGDVARFCDLARSILSELT
ncbi:MAG TPA: hypothetical protein VMU80_07980 [Bryobacteraceae bacterium]|nr:hypothetical protein [Bryobacteraceae bacterium]